MIEWELFITIKRPDAQTGVGKVAMVGSRDGQEIGSIEKYGEHKDLMGNVQAVTQPSDHIPRLREKCLKAACMIAEYGYEGWEDHLKNINENELDAVVEKWKDKIHFNEYTTTHN